MGTTYKINDGVRRAKAADLAGHDTIWARVGRNVVERKVPIRALRSPKTEIDLRPRGERERWESVKAGMAKEPDLFPPIDVVPSADGVPIEDVRVSNGPGRD